MREYQELEESLIKNEIGTKPKRLSYILDKLNPDISEWLPKEIKQVTTLKQRVFVVRIQRTTLTNQKFMIIV